MTELVVDGVSAEPTFSTRSNTVARGRSVMHRAADDGEQGLWQINRVEHDDREPELPWGVTHFEVVVQLPKSCGVTVTFPWQGRPDA
ncbi:hypothetical protein [Streptomyces sp900116325]|uniref:hypothetical protein n=1 Tax=Streptomyces sp. 900116325 TaxID=3154295 RepID=UPI0033A1ED0C